MRHVRVVAWMVAAAMAAVGTTGCSIKLVKRSPSDVEQLDSLSQQVEDLRLLSQQKSEEAEQLRKAKAELEQQLAKEIQEHQVSVGMDERGLVVTFLAEILFDSGKAKVRAEAKPILDKVARVLNQDVADQPIGIEGHTDNEPIRHSGWKSNWELSTARATSVLHYIVDERSVTPARVSAIGYGEYRPVTSNETAEGRQKNRRVEIVILPKAWSKMQAQAQAPAAASSAEDASFYK